METILSFGVWIKRRRKALDLTQDDLAHLVGCSLETIRKIEGDARRPSRQIAALLAEHLELPPEEREDFIRCARAELRADRLPPPARGAARAAFVPAPSPAPLTPDLHQTNLPAQPNALIGRQREIAEVTGLLRGDDVRLLTLTGPGGTGKTRLALAAAAELARWNVETFQCSNVPTVGEGQFVDGIFFVNLAPIRDAALVLPTIAQTLGVIEMGDQPIEQRLKAYLRAKQMLLLLDNFEQVIDAAPQIGELLAAAPGLKVLATSRATLHIYGEHEYAVPPLGLPPIAVRTLERSNVQTFNAEITQYEAVRLFIDRARAAKADFAVTNENAPAVAEICCQLDGLPLAIELAAARVKLFSPETLLARLSQPLALLTGGPRDLPARQQTLRNTIEWSYDLLDEAEQALFRRLGMFVGGCTLDGAEAVCVGVGSWELGDGSASPAPNPQSPTPIPDGLISLIDKSLLRQEDGPDGEPRFMMLETVREYALERLVESGEEYTAQRRHAEYFLALAESAAPQLHMAEQRTWLARLEAEHSNLRAALVWSQMADIKADFGLQLATALAEFWEMRGHMNEGRGWLSDALARAPEPTLFRARALNALGYLTGWSGGAPAYQFFEESLALGQALGDKQPIADALFGLARFGEGSLDYDQYDCLKTSLALCRELGDKVGSVRALHYLGYTVGTEGDYQRGTELCKEALALAREMGDLRGCANVLHAWGRIARAHNDPMHAQAYLQESLKLLRDLGDQSGALWPLLGLADVAQSQGDYRWAETLLNEAIELCRRLSSNRVLAWALINLGDIALYQGDAARAGALFAESLALFREFGSEGGIAQCLLGFAGVFGASGQGRRAARLCGAVEALLESDGVSIESYLPPDDRVHYDRTIAAIRAQLDEATFAAAWAEGQQMTLEQAIAEALDR
jgi:predicted ATPase/DNA-binding XRE family transcriptional regulator